MTGDLPALIGDIGGTNARFALVEPKSGDIQHLHTYAAADFPSLDAAARTYLERCAPGLGVVDAAFAIAAPVSHGDIHFTNSPWRFTANSLADDLGLKRLRLLNDFTAIAVSIPSLDGADILGIGGGIADPTAPLAVIGPGTGLGVSVLVPLPGGGFTALETEGGHVTMAAANDREAEVIAALRRDYGHVSAERVLSGPGLVNLYRVLRQLGEVPPIRHAPEEIVKGAVNRECPYCGQALDMFFAMLGTVAGNLALTTGARGGVLLAGGILPRLPDWLIASTFRDRFETKGRFMNWLEAVPTGLIVHAEPALLGLSHLVRSPAGRPGAGLGVSVER